MLGCDGSASIARLRPPALDRRASKEAIMAQQLLTCDLRKALLANGARSARGEDIDPAPVVKLFTPDANATWLLTELDPSDSDRAFGLCDLGLGCPELGYVSILELRALRGPFGLPVERDEWFSADKPLSSYAEQAAAAGCISA